MSNDDSAADGPGKLLAYAFFPTDGRIRFDPGETWMQRYDNNDANFRLVATHEIAYALGLEHSSDQSSIMAPYYKLMQPEALLPENDRHGIQALYGTNAPSADGCAAWCHGQGKSCGVCGNGHTCICSMNELTKEDIGDGCTSDVWCRNRGYDKGGVYGDDYTCICGSTANQLTV
ncbi:unnamed protein product [Rotaria sp. Silwood1]|nr:unnamed protein product [Rotaria sp. Silwood1]CAF4819789.1 unnamed protein product [Rotaria sp. Silwood1]